VVDIIVSVIFAMGLVAACEHLYRAVYWLAYGRVKLPE
jgi:hypothetical protein